MTLSQLQHPFALGPRGQYLLPQPGEPLVYNGRPLRHQPREPLNAFVTDLLRVPVHGAVTFLPDLTNN